MRISIGSLSPCDRGSLFIVWAHTHPSTNLSHGTATKRLNLTTYFSVMDQLKTCLTGPFKKLRETSLLCAGEVVLLPAPSTPVTPPWWLEGFSFTHQHFVADYALGIHFFAVIFLPPLPGYNWVWQFSSSPQTWCPPQPEPPTRGGHLFPFSLFPPQVSSPSMGQFCWKQLMISSKISERQLRLTTLPRGFSCTGAEHCPFPGPVIPLKISVLFQAWMLLAP